MSQTIVIQSINYDGEMATVLFKPDNANVVINLGNVILPYLFDPSLLNPPRDIYGTYTILVLGDDGNCKTDCPNILQVPRPTPTPTPTQTVTRTQTPTVTPTITPTPSYDPCKVPTSTPTTTSTPTITPTHTPTPSATCTNPCGCPEPSNTPKPQKTPRPTPSTTSGYCYPTPTPTSTTPLVSMSLFALYSSGSTNIEYQISINTPSTKNINITFENILFLRSGDPVVLTGQTISIFSGQTFNVTTERIDTDYSNLNGIVGFDDFFVTADGEPILYEILTSYSFLQPISSPTPTPTNTPTPTITNTPTITKTPTNTPTPTVTETPTNTPTLTPTNTPTITNTPTVTETPTNTPTLTPTNTPTITNTPTVTETPTNTPTPTLTETPSNTPTLTPTNTPTYEPVLRNIVLYYDPSNPSSYSGSGTTINDLSGNGLNGTMSNISFTSPYFTYNGTSSQISVADNALLEPGSGSWTIEVWVNQTVSGNDVVIGKFDNGGLSQDVSYSIRTLGTAYYSQIGSGSGSGSSLFVDSTRYTGTTNTWYQIVYVFTNDSDKTLETFVNGTSIGSVSHGLANILNSTNPLYIGSYNNGEYSQWFDGRIGIVRLYSSALTPSEVLQNYNYDNGKYI